MKGCGDKCAKQREHQVQRHDSGTCMMHSRYEGKEGKARVEIKSWHGKKWNWKGKQRADYRRPCRATTDSVFIIRAMGSHWNVTQSV